MKLSSKHAYSGSNLPFFFDVLVGEATVVFAMWEHTPDVEATLSRENWKHREIEYPATGTTAKSEVLGANKKGAIYTLRGTSVFDLNSRIGAGEWVDRSNWLFPITGDQPQSPINVNLETYRSKSRSPRYLMQKGMNCALQMIVPFTSRALKDCTYSLCYNEEHGFASNIKKWAEVTFVDVTQNGYNFKFYPILKIAGDKTVEKDGTVTLNLTLTTPEGESLPGETSEAYIESISGYLPKTRVQVKGGTKTPFKVMALGLDAGDEIRVKVGFRHYTGVAEHTLTVI